MTGACGSLGAGAGVSRRGPWGTRGRRRSRLRTVGRTCPSSACMGARGRSSCSRCFGLGFSISTRAIWDGCVCMDTGWSTHISCIRIRVGRRAPCRDAGGDGREQDGWSADRRRAQCLEKGALPCRGGEEEAARILGRTRRTHHYSRIAHSSLHRGQTSPRPPHRNPAQSRRRGVRAVWKKGGRDLGERGAHFAGQGSWTSCLRQWAVEERPMTEEGIEIEAVAAAGTGGVDQARGWPLLRKRWETGCTPEAVPR